MGINKLDFDSIIKPYSKAGTENSPIDLTFSDICTELIYRFRVPPDVAGCVIFETMLRLVNGGLDFSGDGAYGSKARDFMVYLRSTAVEKIKERSVEQVLNSEVVCMRVRCPVRSKRIKSKKSRVMNFILKPRRLFWLPTWRM